MAPLRPVDTTTLTIPAASPATGRLRLITAGVTRRGDRRLGGRTAVARARPLPPVWSAPRTGLRTSPRRRSRASFRQPGRPRQRLPGRRLQGIVPASFGYARAAERLRTLLSAGYVGAVLAAGDEGVLISNRLNAPLPVIDQVSLADLAGAQLIAVEVRRAR